MANCSAVSIDVIRDMKIVCGKISKMHQDGLKYEAKYAKSKCEQDKNILLSINDRNAKYRAELNAIIMQIIKE